MTATVYYDSMNEIALISGTFLNGAQVPNDPNTVSIVVTDPAGNAVTHTYQGTGEADVLRSAVGVYTLTVPCSPSVPGIEGLWSYVWIGAGAVSDVQPGTWRVFPTGLGNFYCGLEELKDRLGITDNTDDFAAQQAVQAASTWIQEYTGQHFYRLTESRTFVPHSIWELTVDPLVGITSLNVDQDGDGVFEDVWVQNTDYQLRLGRDRYNINALGVKRPFKQVQVLQSGKWFPYIYPYAHFDRVQITGTWGWPAVPPPVSQACLVLAAQWFKEKDAPFGVAGVSDFGVVRIQSNPWLVEMLRPYTEQEKKVGVLWSEQGRC